MSGTKGGGRKAAQTNRELYGEDYYGSIGKLGGAVPHPETRAFRVNRDLARSAGYKGGKISRRKPRWQTL